METWNALIKSVLIEAVIVQIVLVPLILFLSWPLIERLQIPIRSNSFPSFFQAFVAFTLSYFFLELSFYTSHRLLHHPLLYSTFHKQHHQFVHTQM